jgi:protein-S-isoprenylcysteine O-methyltransferase Ste14
MPRVDFYIDAAWIVVCMVWLAGAFRSKRTAQAQTIGSSLAQALLTIAAVVLLFNSHLAVGPLAWRFVPDSAFITYTGVALTWAGTGFAIWARAYLGQNWSSNVTIKEGHQLMQSGPYAVVRHPIYSGFLLGFLGTALALGQLRGLVAWALAFLGWRLKSRMEEKFMRQRFGAEYAAYQRRVKALIPFVL